MGDAVGQQRLEGFVARLNSLGSDTDADELMHLGDKLDAIMENRDLKFPDVDQKDREILTRYLAGNALLLECLHEANVSDPGSVQDRLLLPPE